RPGQLPAPVAHGPEAHLTNLSRDLKKRKIYKKSSHNLYATGASSYKFNSKSRTAIQPRHIQHPLPQQLHRKIPAPAHHPVRMKNLAVADRAPLHTRIALPTVQRITVEHGGHVECRVERLRQRTAEFGRVFNGH